MAPKIARTAPTARAFAEAAAPIPAPPGRDAARDAASDAARDVGRYGAAVALAAALGIVQVLVIPRRLDVTTFGAWRVFLVYAAYLGALHLGLADGAFLRWAGRPAGVVGREWRRVAGWLLALQGALLAAAVAALPLVGAPLAGARFARAFVVGFAACALSMNATTLAGYALQATGDFRGAGRVAVLGPALFAAAVLLLPLHSIERVIAAYAASFGVAALFGAMRAARLRGGDAVPGLAGAAAPRPLALVRDGLPVLGANLAAGVSLFADRVLVSATVPLATFAQYGFASSAMVAASTATQALSRVALSHAARRDAALGARAAFVDGFHDLVAVLSGIAFLGVPAFELLVARLLPAYVPALPIVRALAVGAPFGVAVHVVLVGTLQSYGLVRRQLALELTGLALVLAACGACLAAHRPLWQVAAAASVAAAMTWTVGVVAVRRSVGAARLDAAARFALAAGAQAAALLVALATFAHPAARTLAYAALAAWPTVMVARAARAHGWR